MSIIGEQLACVRGVVVARVVEMKMLCLKFFQTIHLHIYL